MKVETTSTRLKRIMSVRNLRQVDILKMAEPFCRKHNIKLEKNDLSQYVSGKVEPKQDKLTVLGLALDVSEAWLMGYNVPSIRPDMDFSKYIYPCTQTLTVYNMDGVEGAHEIQLNSNNIKAISSLINEVRSLPPEKIEAIIQLVKTLK